MNKPEGEEFATSGEEGKEGVDTTGGGTTEKRGEVREKKKSVCDTKGIKKKVNRHKKWIEAWIWMSRSANEGLWPLHCKNAPHTPPASPEK